MNIDDLKYIIDPSDPIEDMLRFEGYNQAIDDLHAQGLLMVWNEDMSAAPKDVECLFLMDAAFGVNFSRDPRHILKCVYGRWASLYRAIAWANLPKGDA